MNPVITTPEETPDASLFSIKETLFLYFEFLLEIYPEMFLNREM